MAEETMDCTVESQEEETIDDIDGEELDTSGVAETADGDTEVAEADDGAEVVAEADEQPSKRQCIDTELSKYFDPNMVNEKVTLATFRIPKGTLVIYSNLTQGQGNCEKLAVLKSAVPGSGGPALKIDYTRENVEDDKIKASVYFNGIRIASDVGSQHRSCRVSAATNALNYLISQGITLMPASEVKEENKFALDMSSVLEKYSGKKKLIQEFIQEELIKFLLDPKLIQLNVTGFVHPTKRYSVEQKILMERATKSSLTCRITGGKKGVPCQIEILKRSSTRHIIECEAEPLDAMQVEEVEEIDEKDKLAEKPPIDQIIQFKAKLNKDLKLNSLGLSDFRAITDSAASADTIIKSMCEACGVTHKTVKGNPTNLKQGARSQYLYINKIFVAEGIKKVQAGQEEKAYRSAAYQAYVHGLKLLKFNNLSINHQTEVDDNEVQHIGRDILTLKGDDLRVIEEAVEEVFESFLNDPKIVKLIISNELDKYEREVVLNHAEKHKLGFNIEGTAHIAIWKVNNKIHKMDVPPPPVVEEPVAEEITPPTDVLEVSKEDVTANGTDLRKVTECVEEKLQHLSTSTELQKLRFSGDLDKYEKGVVEKSASKWELEFSVEEETGVMIVSKPPPKPAPKPAPKPSPKPASANKTVLIHSNNKSNISNKMRSNRNQNPRKPAPYMNQRAGNQYQNQRRQRGGGVRPPVDLRHSITRTITYNYAQNQNQMNQPPAYREDANAARQRQQREDYLRYVEQQKNRNSSVGYTGPQPLGYGNQGGYQSAAYSGNPISGSHMLNHSRQPNYSQNRGRR